MKAFRKAKKDREAAEAAAARSEAAAAEAKKEADRAEAAADRVEAAAASGTGPSHVTNNYNNITNINLALAPPGPPAGEPEPKRLKQ